VSEKDFAIRMIRVASSIPITPESSVIRRPLARAGTSIGATIEEADGGLSKKDKRRSFAIARKEVRETRSWLHIIQRLWSPAVLVDDDVAEATELLSILSAIISRLE
jgi:four helix bundle protein